VIGTRKLPRHQRNMARPDSARPSLRWSIDGCIKRPTSTNLCASSLWNCVEVCAQFCVPRRQPLVAAAMATTCSCNPTTIPLLFHQPIQTPIPPFAFHVLHHDFLLGQIQARCHVGSAIEVANYISTSNQVRACVLQWQLPLYPPTFLESTTATWPGSTTFHLRLPDDHST